MVKAVLDDQKRLARAGVKAVKMASPIQNIVENVGAAHPRSHRTRLLRCGKTKLRDIQVAVLRRKKTDLRHLPAPFRYHCITAMLYCKRKA